MNHDIALRCPWRRRGVTRVLACVVVAMIGCPGTLLAAPPLAACPDSVTQAGHQNKTTKLRPELVERLREYHGRGCTAAAAHEAQGARTQAAVLVNAVAKGDPQVLLQDLKALGLQATGVYGRIVSGRLPDAALAELDALDSLNEIHLDRVLTQHGLATSQGDRSQRSDLARQQFGVSGSGVTIGVISDSYDCLGGASADRQSDDLPQDAAAIEDALDCTGRTDEGRALMQVIYDVAPGARLLFHSGANGLANTANAILDLAFRHQVDIIVDDQKSLGANFFQHDALTQAVERVVRAGVVYITAAGNSGRNSYQGPYNEYVNVASRLNAHDFDPGPGVDLHQRIVVPEGTGFFLLLQWSSPAYSISGPPGAQTDLDIFIFDHAHTQALASSTFGNLGRDPVEVLSFFNPQGSGQTNFDIMITKASGKAPSLLKYIILNSVDGMIREFSTDSSGLFGHANSDAALTVGAANFSDTPAFGVSPPLLQSYSSSGGTPITFDLQGAPLREPITPSKPDLIAPDNVNTTFFGVDADNDGLPNFSGTSASAPHAAGVAALLLEINPDFQPVDIKQILTTTAVDIVQRNDEGRTVTGVGFDLDSGFGLIDAQAATELARNYAASKPQDPSDADKSPIMVNDPNQTGGGGAGVLELVILMAMAGAMRLRCAGRALRRRCAGRL